MARWFRFGLSVPGSFVCRCLTIQAMLRFYIPLVGRVEDWRGVPQVRPILVLPVSSESASLAKP